MSFSTRLFKYILIFTLFTIPNFVIAQNVGTKTYSSKNLPPASVKAQEGETLFDIAERTQSPLIGIIKLNKMTSPFYIKNGQIIKIPPLKVHIVKVDEKFSQIAKRYSVDMRSLAVFNGLKKPYDVKKGQRIILPALVRDSLTGLEPMDLVELLSAELNRGSIISGKPSQKIVTKPINIPKPITIDKNTNTKTAFIWPLKGKIVEKYGEKPGFRKNDGIDIEALENTPFYAADDGVVVYAGNQLEGYGWLILVRHSNNFVTAYAYGAEIFVAENDIVKKGQKIGSVGLTGRASSPRLHFQIRKGTEAINPINFLPTL